MANIKPGKDGIYFTPNKNSELYELQDELESMKVDQQKDAMKQIIAAMTLAKDVSPLFPSVVNCMRTTNVELKKLIYLYIINYAKTKPLESILAVNAFLQDANDRKSPLIRALAIRTMGCIRLDQIVAYLCDTLKGSLADEDAYVRKTACICVAKLFNTCPSLVRDHGFIDTLSSLLHDGNSMVVSNAIMALLEISVLSAENHMKINSKVLKRILLALNEANEWGQVYILDALMNYKKKKTKYATMIIDSVIPRLKHANPAVIFSALKVILKYLDHIENEEIVKQYSKRVGSSLITLMDVAPEIKYLLLRAMHAIIQKRHYLIDKDFRAFFIQFIDPVYVKLEKVDILYKLVDSKNYEMILREFRTYAIQELDMELIQKAIKYLGLIGFKFPKAVDACIDSLCQILDYNQDYTVNQAVIVIRDILRKHSKQSPKVKELLRKINYLLLQKITLPESKAAILFIIGENCLQLEDSTEFIKFFLENYGSENEKVKLQILNAGLKNFINKPEDTQAEEAIRKILQLGAEEEVNPDVRDRSYFYWRLLEVDPDSAKEMLTREKPEFEIKDDTELDSRLCDDIIENMTNISCIYHRRAQDLIVKEDLLMEETIENNEEQSDSKGPKKIKGQEVNTNDADLLGLGDTFQNVTSTPAINLQTLDLFSTGSNFNEMDIVFVDQGSVVIFNENSGATIPKPHLSFKHSDKGKTGTCGVAFYSSVQRENQRLLLGLNIQNNIKVSLNNFNVTLRENSFGVKVKNSQVKDFFVNSETNKNLILDLEVNQEHNNKIAPTTPYFIDCLVSNNVDDFAFKIPFPLNVLLTETGKMSNQAFVPFFKQYSPSKQSMTLNNSKLNEEIISKQFERNNIFLVAKNTKVQPPILYYSCAVSNTIPIVIEVVTKDLKMTVSVIAGVEPIIPLMKESLSLILN